jgi:hypothetical protein
MESLIQTLGGYTPSTTVQWSVAILAVMSAVYVLYMSRTGYFARWADHGSETELIQGLVVGTVLGTLTGILWASFNPVKVVPPYIHLRLFAFLPPVIGIVFGRGAGFVSGYVATMVWAPMAGAFVPLHTPLADGFFVGLTGWIPGWLLRGNLKPAELLALISANTRSWYLRSGVVMLFTGLFMAFFVALSLELTTPLPFWLSFWAIGVISDTIPMVLLTGVATLLLLRATRPAWTWMPQF